MAAKANDMSDTDYNENSSAENAHGMWCTVGQYCNV